MIKVVLPIEKQVGNKVDGKIPLGLLCSWLIRQHGICPSSIYQPAELRNAGEYYTIREPKGDYVIFLLPETVALLAKLTWGGK